MTKGVWFQAIKDGDWRSVQRLILQGVNVNQGSADGSSPLHIAALFGRIKCAMVLIEAGANLFATDYFESSLLHTALMAKHSKMADFLIEKMAPRIDEEDYLGNSPLHLAAERGIFSSVDLLLKKGAMLNRRNKKGETPLLKSIDRDLVMALHLIDKGADLNQADLDNTSPLHLFIMARCPLEAVEKMIQSGGNINVQDSHGFTPLHYAAKYSSGSETYVFSLLGLGADPSIRTHTGILAEEFPQHQKLHEKLLDARIRQETEDLKKSLPKNVCYSSKKSPRI